MTTKAMPYATRMSELPKAASTNRGIAIETDPVVRRYTAIRYPACCSSCMRSYSAPVSSQSSYSRTPSSPNF